MAIKHTIKAEIREVKGKKVGLLRKKGILPIVGYGPQQDNISLQVDSIEFTKIYKEVGNTSLFNIEVKGKKTPVLIYHLQFDPLTDEIRHADVYAPNLKQEVEVDVPLVFIGESLAVKDLGGELVKNIREFGVKSLPTEIPSELEIDISVLNTFEDRVLVKDVKLPKGVVATRNEDDIIVLVTAHVEVEKELEAEITEDVDSVEKVGEKKEEEETKE